MSVTEDFQGLRVLVVEDNSLICLLFEDMLMDLGCNVRRGGLRFQAGERVGARPGQHRCCNSRRKSGRALGFPDCG